MFNVIQTTHFCSVHFEWCKNPIHEHGPGLFGMEQRKRYLGTKDTETQEGWEKLCNTEIHNSYHAS